MVDVSGIPNMGFGGGGYFGGSASMGLPAMSADQINASMGGFNPNAQQFDPWGNTPGGFGGQTDYYSGLGAAYGRETGGFGAAPSNSIPGGYPSGGVESAPLAPLPYQDPFSGGGGGGVQPSYDEILFGGGGGGGIGSDSAAAPGAMFDTSRYPQMYRMPEANPQAFNPGGYAGDQSNYGIPFNGAPLPGDIGFTSQSPMPNQGYNPGMENWFANPGMGGGFGAQFGQWGPDPGTPSQYTSSPYTNTQGQTFQPNMPPGYAPPFGADQPGGALPLGYQTWGSGGSYQPGG